jgi:hypothetical protein
MRYVPEGGGSYHWQVTDEDGRPHFVTVDDLDDKDWMGEERAAVLEGLGRALSTAAALLRRAILISCTPASGAPRHGHRPAHRVL